MLTSPFSLLAIFLALCIVSVLMTHWMLVRVRILDIANERSSHSGAKPKSGGVSIVTCFYIIVLFLVYRNAQVISIFWMVFFFSALLLSIISFIDDLKDISAKLRLMVHAFLCFLMLASGWALQEISLPIGQLNLGIWAYLISFLWLLGLTNACNFIDGIDGLVASMVAIACAIFSWINYSAGNDIAMLLSLSISAGAVGFLCFNWSPAKIFMGDVGSAFLGFVLAALAIYAATHAPQKIDFWVMPLLLGHLIFDAVLTFIRRLLRGDNVLQAHREHLYQLLVRSGYSHAKVTTIAIFMTLFHGVGALLMLQLPEQSRLYVIVFFILIQALYALWVLRFTRPAK